MADVIQAVSPVPFERLEASSLGNWAISQAIAAMQVQLPDLAGTLIGRDPADGGD